MQEVKEDDSFFSKSDRTHSAKEQRTIKEKIGKYGNKIIVNPHVPKLTMFKDPFSD